MEASGAVLLVEDDPNDAILIRHAFRTVGLGNRLIVLSDGRQAVRYLNGEGPYRDREQYPMPVLILLDLDLPELNGFQFLEWVRKEPELSRLPVIVLTGSTFSPDVKLAYSLGANSFLVKPTHPGDFAAMLKTTADYWLGTSQLPDAPTAQTRPSSRPELDDSQQFETG